MNDFGSLNAEARGTELPAGTQLGARRPSTPAQRRRESLVDRRLEIAAATGGITLAATCGVVGAWAASAAWGVDHFTVVAILGVIAACGGAVLTAHFAVTIGRITGVLGGPTGATVHGVPPEAWLIAVVLGGVGGAATGIDLGTVILIVGGRTLWDLPPATTMVAVVVLPIIGLLPLSMGVGAAARRAWLRRPVLLASATWLAGAVAGAIGSGVLSHLPGV